MTEKSLLLKCDFAGHYFIVGTDFPAARVFDTTTSSLAAVVELPLRSRAVSLAALTLTSVAIRAAEEEAGAAVSCVSGNAASRHRSEALIDDQVTTYYAAVGLSNGSVIIHNVRRDAQIGHVQVSETQQPIISLQMCGGYAFCLAANHMLYVVSIQNASAGPCLRLRVQPDASTIAVTLLNNADTAVVSAAPTAPGTTASHRVFRVLVAGPTNALYEVSALASNPTVSGSGVMTGSAANNMADTPQVHATKLLAFPSQGTSAEFAWVSGVTPATVSTGGVTATPTSLPAITASVQDGVVRIWDVQHTPSLSSAAALLPAAALDSATASSSAVVARCRRTLLCGQRMLNISVLPDTDNGTRKGNYVMVTTLTGSVLLWSLGDCILPPVVEPVPLKPDVVLVSAVAAGRLLFGALRSASGAPTRTNSSGTLLHALEMTLLRGRFALPIFETKNIGDAVEQASSAAATTPSPVATRDAAAGPKGKTKALTTNAVNARRTALATLALGVAGTTAGAVTVVELPLNAAHASLLANQRDAEYLLQRTTDATTSAFVVMDTVWAAHQQQVAAKANQSMTDAFKAPQLYHAKSIQNLPVRQYTLEQRLRQVARDEAAATARRRQLVTDSAAASKGDSNADDALDQPQVGGTDDSRSVVSHHALGLATVPLYQALHANDTSAVMDLLNMTARSAEGMRATVLSLQLPYCLQLLHVVSERLGMCSKAVERVDPPPQGDVGDRAVSTAKHETSVATNGSTTVDAAAQSVDENKNSSNVDDNGGAALRGGLAAFSIRSSLLEWIDAIVHYRGSELLAVQRDWDAREAAGETSEATGPTVASPPKDFLAPILHHYETLCSQYDKLAVLYGRLSIFKSVRPSQKNEFTNIPRKSLSSNLEMGRPAPAVKDGLATSSGPDKRRLHLTGRSSVVDDDIIFPVMFKESRSRSGHRVVRVRSKIEIEKKRRQRENGDAALHKRARALAHKQLASSKRGHSILDGDSDMTQGGGLGSLDVMNQIMIDEMGGKDGRIDLDALEAMDLADDSSHEDMTSDDASDSEVGTTLSSSDDDEEEEEEGKNPTAESSKKKKARRDTGVTDEMLADVEDEGSDDNNEDYNEALDSSEAEFSSGSDDEVNSDLADDQGEDDADTDDSDAEEEEESNDDVEVKASDVSDDDDGMDENMKELLTRHDDNEDRTDRRKTKKVRID